MGRGYQQNGQAKRRAQAPTLFWLANKLASDAALAAEAESKSLCLLSIMRDLATRSSSALYEVEAKSAEAADLAVPAAESAAEAALDAAVAAAWAFWEISRASLVCSYQSVLATLSASAFLRVPSSRSYGRP